MPPTLEVEQLDRITKSPLLASLLVSYQVKKALARLAPAVWAAAVVLLNPRTQLTATFAERVL